MLEGDELDEEELAFKKSLEEQDEEFGNDEELEFDDKELAQLRMLDEYREDIMNDEEGMEEEEAEDLESDAKTKKTVEMTAKKHKEKDDSDSLGKTSDKNWKKNQNKLEQHWELKNIYTNYLANKSKNVEKLSKKQNK